jgi:hypothetical protein
MQIEGTLEAMNLPTLVQFLAQERSSSLIQLEHNDQIGLLYMDKGQLCHAEMRGTKATDTGIRTGEEVVYELLSWHTGKFKVQKEVKSPQNSIQQGWDFLLMEGLRQLDERQAGLAEEHEEESLAELLSELSEADAAILKGMVAQQKEEIDMANLNQTLEEIMKIDGAIAAALVDWESGLTLGTIGSGLNIDLAAAGNTNVVRSKLSVMKDLKLKGGLEDILITLTEQYHLIRILGDNPNLFIYVALSRTHANLGMARHRLMAIEKELAL